MPITSKRSTCVGPEDISLITRIINEKASYTFCQIWILKTVERTTINLLTEYRVAASALIFLVITGIMQMWTQLWDVSKQNETSALTNP